MTADVVAFLRAALDEVERVARAAIAGLEVHGLGVPDPGRSDWSEWQSQSDRVIATYAGDVTDDLGNGRLANHIALHDPRAALARVQAEKRLVDECSRVLSEGWPRVMPGIGYMEDTVRLLAHGHRYTVPGYDPAWAPEGVSVDV